MFVAPSVDTITKNALLVRHVRIGFKKPHLKDDKGAVEVRRSTAAYAACILRGKAGRTAKAGTIPVARAVVIRAIVVRPALLSGMLSSVRCCHTG